MLVLKSVGAFSVLSCYSPTCEAVVSRGEHGSESWCVLDIETVFEGIGYIRVYEHKYIKRHINGNLCANPSISKLCTRETVHKHK